MKWIFIYCKRWTSNNGPHRWLGKRNMVILPSADRQLNARRSSQSRLVNIGTLNPMLRVKWVPRSLHVKKYKCTHSKDSGLHFLEFARTFIFRSLFYFYKEFIYDLKICLVISSSLMTVSWTLNTNFSTCWANNSHNYTSPSTLYLCLHQVKNMTLVYHYKQWFRNCIALSRTWMKYLPLNDKQSSTRGN